MPTDLKLPVNLGDDSYILIESLKRRLLELQIHIN